MSKLNKKEQEFLEKVNDLLKSYSIIDMTIHATSDKECCWKKFLQDVFEVDYDSCIGIKVEPNFLTIKFSELYRNEMFTIFYKIGLKPDGNIDFSKVFKHTYIPKD